jgi:hypothetical protein
MATGDRYVNIPFLTDEVPDVLINRGAFFDLTGGAGGLGPGTGALVLTGYAPIVLITTGLLLTFDIWDPVTTPLVILFDVLAGVGSKPDPLLVMFDIVEENSTPLLITFDILPAALVDRASGVTTVGGAKRSGDVQAPIAKVRFT